MVTAETRSRSRRAIPAWHEVFLRMLPAIRQHARISFRHLPTERREDCVEEAICNACCAVARLAELNKLDLAYAGPLGRYAVAQVKDNRRVGNRLCIGDVMSPYCQQRKSVVVERLDAYDSTEDCWQEIVIEDRHCGPFDIVRTKLDFAAWLRSLPIKLRRVAKTLANGERTSDVAARFQLSDGRISQVRSELRASWRRFIGEVDPPEATAVPA